MNLDELKAMTFSEIEHSGKKGMKWGVRKADKAPKAKKEPGKIKKSMASTKREGMLLKDLRNPSKFTDSELKTKTARIKGENDLKRLTETKGITSKTKKAFAKREVYWDRGKLSDSELKTKVDRFQLEDNLKRQIKSANKTNISAANGVIKEASKFALSSFSDSKGNFSATGDPVYDALISAALGQTSKKNMILQSSEGNELMVKKDFFDMTVSELEHSGKKGMKWGVRKAGKSYMDASKKHEGKTQARRDKDTERRKTTRANEQALAKKVGTKYMDASKKHEAKTVAKRERSVARTKKAYNSTLKVINNPKLKESVNTLINANAALVITNASYKTDIVNSQAWD